MDPIVPSVRVRVATVEIEHAEEVCEALAAAGVEAEARSIVPMTQVEAVRHGHRPMADILVDGAREAEARAIVAAWESQGEAAAEEQAERPSPADESTAPGEAAPRKVEGPPRAIGVAVLLALVGLAALSAIVAGFDHAIGVIAERWPAAFPIVGIAFMAIVFLVVRRRR